MTELEQILCDLLAGMDGVEVAISAEADLLTGLELDSVQIMEFMMEVEDHFDIIIPEHQLTDVRTIAALGTVVSSSLL